MLLKTIPAACAGNERRDLINIKLLHYVEKDQRRKELFKNIVLGENEEDKLEDLAGYTGDMFKNKMDRGIKRSPMEVEELFQLMANSNKMKEVSLAFKEIDPDRTGYVTAPEIDDLFRFLYPEEFKDKTMFGIVRPFEISSNRILIEYGKFRKWLLCELNLRKPVEPDLSKTVSSNAQRTSKEPPATALSKKRPAFDAISSRSRISQLV